MNSKAKLSELINKVGDSYGLRNHQGQVEILLWKSDAYLMFRLSTAYCVIDTNVEYNTNNIRTLIETILEKYPNITSIKVTPTTDSGLHGLTEYEKKQFKETVKRIRNV